MSTNESNGIPPDVLAELDEAIRAAMSGPPDPEVMREACEEQDRAREELRQRVGELNVAVDLIREVRDEA
jgi:hypothetical protein